MISINTDAIRIKLLLTTLFRGEFVYGAGIENYMNEGPADIGVGLTGDPQKLLEGVPLPFTGIVAFFDHTWSEKFTSSAGYSYVHIDNTEASDPSQFKTGNYVVANLLYIPVPNVMAGVELQYGNRENFTDRFTSSATKVQFSFRYNFLYSLYK